MHKYRAAAKQAAWYSEENDPTNYNPFRRAGSREQALHTPYEHPHRTRQGAQISDFTSAPSEKQSDEDVHKAEETVVPDASNSKIRRSLGKPITIHKPRDEEQGLLLPSRAFASWKSWSQQKLSYAWRQTVLASGSRRSGDVKRSFADMGMSVISHAPLGTKGVPFLQVPGRRRRVMVIEYAKPDGDITKTNQESADIMRNSTRLAIRAITDVRTGAPLLFRFYEKQSRRDDNNHILDDHQTKSEVKSLCTLLLEQLSSVGKPLLSQRNSRMLTNRSEHFPHAHRT